MASFSKEFLSGSTNGRGIKVVAAATPGTQVHQAHATAKDEVWLWVTNTDVVDRTLTVEFGGTTAPDDTMKIIVPAGDKVIAVEGCILSNSLNMKCFGSAANVLSVWGFVNRIS